MRVLKCAHCGEAWEDAAKGGLPRPLCPACAHSLKRCYGCKQIKAHVDFGKDRTTRDGVGARCRDCSAARHLRQRKDRPLKTKETRLKSRYRISLQSWEEMFEAQSGRCAICREAPAAGRFGLVVDHCHSTGLVRGLLCAPCNSGIGFLGDNADRALAAAVYLRDNLAIEPTKPVGPEACSHGEVDHCLECFREIRRSYMRAQRAVAEPCGQPIGADLCKRAAGHDGKHMGGRSFDYRVSGS